MTDRTKPEFDAPSGPAPSDLVIRDIIVGDGEGVCVIPAHLANEIAPEVYEQTAYEDFVAERVRGGQGIFGLYPANEQTKAEFAAWRPGWS